MERIALLAAGITILVMASALVLSAFPSISDYISSYIIERLSIASGGMIQVLNAEFRGDIVIIDVKNMGPSDLNIKGPGNFQIYIDKRPAVVESVQSGQWPVGTAVRVVARLDADPHRTHTIVLYSPGTCNVYIFTTYMDEKTQEAASEQKDPHLYIPSLQFFYVLNFAGIWFIY